MPVKENINELVDQLAEMPRTECTVLCHEVVQNPSSKGSAMDYFKLEIVAPEVVVFAGKQVKLAGRKVDMYVSYADGARKRSIEALRKLGVPIGDDYEVPTKEEIEAKSFTKCTFQDLTKNLERTYWTMTLQSEPFYKTDNGNWDGKVVRDSRGNPIIEGHRVRGNISDVTGAAVNGENQLAF